MAHILGQRATITLEYPDGRVLSGDAFATQLTVSNDASLDVGDTLFRSYVRKRGLQEWELTFTGTGAITQRMEFEQALEKRRAAPDWECPYCGATHPKSRQKCWDGVSGCGAFRPLLH